MTATYQSLIDRLALDDDHDLSVRRTARGVTLEKNGVRLELVGKEQDFGWYVGSLARDAKAAFGTADGLNLFLAHVQESLESAASVSARWEFSRSRLGRPVLKKTVLG